MISLLDTSAPPEAGARRYVQARVDLAVPLHDAAPAFADLPHLAVLDGGDAAGPEARWTYLVADPVDTIRWDPSGVVSGAGRGAAGDGFQALTNLLQHHHREPGAGPPFAGGAVGYLAYDVAYALERLPATCPGQPPAGYLWAGVYDWVLARDRLGGATWLVASDAGGRDPDDLIARASARLRSPVAPPNAGGLGPAVAVGAPPAFVAAVRRIREYIAAGDCYQVNVARAIDFDCRASGLDVYRRLVAAHPAPFGAYLAADGLEVISASPELFLSVAGRRVRSRPIKGTRPRAGRRRDDRTLRRALQRSPKDRAENVMIVDVVRNDLGRVCAPGSVAVPALFELEAHPSVWQLVSEVAGDLAPGATSVDALRACSPSGSVTGAPKIRAMEIIDELESSRRGVYCGSVFALGFNGNLNSSVAIRTLQVSAARARLYVGAGIVADSDPELEFDETRDKARGILNALGLDEGGQAPGVR